MQNEKLITITVGRNLLGQVLESAQVRTELMEGDIEAGGFDSDDIADMQKTVAFTRHAIEHVQTAVDNAEQHNAGLHRIPYGLHRIVG